MYYNNDIEKYMYGNSYFLRIMYLGKHHHACDKRIKYLFVLKAKSLKALWFYVAMKVSVYGA